MIKELDSDPDTTPQDKQLLKSASEFLKQLLKSASEFLKPLLNPEPQVLYAGYDAGYYFVKVSGSTKIGTITELQASGYALHFLQPPFGKPVMHKKR